MLVKEGRPLLFFAVTAPCCCWRRWDRRSGGDGVPAHRPGAEAAQRVLATGLVLLSSLTLVCGMVLDSVERGRKEMKRLAYLAIPPRHPGCCI